MCTKVIRLVSYPTHDDGYMVPLELIRVAASIEGSASGLWTRHKHSLQHKLQSEYSLWLPSVGKLQSYDIMLKLMTAAGGPFDFHVAGNVMNETAPSRPPHPRTGAMGPANCEENLG